VNNGVRTNGI